MSLRMNLSMSTNFPHEIAQKFEIKYPTRASFLRHLSKLEAPKREVGGIETVLQERPAPRYLLKSRPKSNIFTWVINDPTKELKRQVIENRTAELNRRTRLKGSHKKINKDFRQQFTAETELKHFVHRENLSEIKKHGRLFGPPNLTFQPKCKLNVPLLDEIKEDADFKYRTSTEALDKEDFVPSVDILENASKDSESSISMNSESLISADASFIEDSESRSLLWEIEKLRENFSQIGNFVGDRRKICLMNLSARIKENLIARLNKKLEDESNYLLQAESDLVFQRKDHDRFIQELTLRTAESLKRAEEENLKRNRRRKLLKRFKHRIDAMQAEYVKLEDEYKRLTTYKTFLDDVIKNVEEKREATRLAALKLSEMSGEEYEAIVSKNGKSDMIENPQDFIDHLTDLETDNLTLIESIQEQDESIELLRLKIKKLQKAISIQNSSWDEYIAKQVDSTSNLLKEASAIETAMEHLKDFTLLKRYKEFSLGDLDQFDSPWLKEEKSTKKQNKMSDNETIGQLLEVLYKEIHKLYFKLFRKEQPSKLNILVMLKNLEMEMNDLDKRQTKYKQVDILKAKKVVNEYNRAVAREERRIIEEKTNEMRRKKAFERSQRPPNIQRGRRVMERSPPPRSKRRVKKTQVDKTSVSTDDTTANFFK